MLQHSTALTSQRLLHWRGWVCSEGAPATLRGPNHLHCQPSRVSVGGGEGGGRQCGTTKDGVFGYQDLCFEGAGGVHWQLSDGGDGSAGAPSVPHRVVGSERCILDTYAVTVLVQTAAAAAGCTSGVRSKARDNAPRAATQQHKFPVFAA